MTKWITAVLVIIMSHHEWALMIFYQKLVLDNKSDDNPYSINVIERECRPNEYKLIGGKKLVKRKKSKIIGSVGHHKDKEPENHFRE